MFNKQQLKPLNYKKVPSTNQPSSKQLLSKVDVKPSPNDTPKTALNKKSSNGETIQPVKYSRSGQRSTKTIEHYDCDDFQLELEDNRYFESQLEKNIKTEILSKTGKPQAKAQIVLPKLQSDAKCRNIKEIEKQMDLQMSRIMQSEFGSHYD